MAAARKRKLAQQQALENYALLTVGDLQLALPQSQVVTIELVGSVIAFSREGSKAAGFIEYEGGEWPVYSLTPELHLRRYVPQKRRFCVCFGRQAQHAFALLCDDVSLLPDTGDALLRDVPDCMLRPGSPLRQLLWMNDRLVLLSDLPLMHQFLETTRVDD